MAATTPQQQHQQQAPPQQPQQPPQQPQQPSTAAQKLAAINEQTWLSMGNLAELMTDYDKATSCYESALRHNPYSVPALTQIASLCRGREQFGRAVDYFKRILAIQENNGETWAALGHCYLMMDNLQDAYHAYQQALYHLSNPKDPKLWYGIGILYDRYGSLEHAEEAFSAVMKMDPKFEKANEIYFRLGIIYKQQQKFDLSLQCFRYILHTPPRPLTESDIWFQTGHVYEQQKEYELAKEAYERVLAENPDHAKVLQQLGWLYHQQNTSFCNQTLAIQYLTRSLKSDSNDAQSWYLLGRCYMAEQNYNKAYEAYQQAVYRDARNPTFWCSIGVLYYQINQYRDALDAYSRAIRLNPYISEVWYDLGTLYESCNNQVQDALDAYQRAAELDPSNPHIKQRLELLRKSQSVQSSQGVGSAPAPRDVSNPNQYQNNPGTQPLNGGYNQAPGPALSSMSSSYGNAPPPPRPDERGGMPVPQTAQENGSGPGRDLPALATNQGERAPPGSHQYQASPSREDVRIPGIGGGQAPAPSDRSQMNPIVAEDAKQRVRQTPPPPPSAVSEHVPPPQQQQRHSPFMKSEEPRTAAPPPPAPAGLQPRGGSWQPSSESPRSAHAPATPYDQHHRSPVAREPVDSRMQSRPDGHQSPYARRDYPNEGPRTPVMKHEHAQQQQQQQQPSEEAGRGYHVEQQRSPQEKPSTQAQPSPQPQHQQQQQQSPAPSAATTTPAAPAEEQQQPSHVQPMDTTSEESKPESKSHEEQQQPVKKESTPAPSQQQDTSTTSRAPVDEDYDESAASALLSMGGNRDNGTQGYKNEGQKRAYSAEESDVSQEGVKRARSGEEESSKPVASETAENDQSVPSPKQQRSSPSPQQQPVATSSPAASEQQQQPKKEESPAPAAAPSSSTPSNTTTQQQQQESPVEDAKEEGEVTDKTPSPSA